MPLSLLLRKDDDETQGKHESDIQYLARMVKKHKHQNNFSALTFRFVYKLQADLATAELACAIAAHEYPGTSLTLTNHFSELELSAASVYMALSVRRQGKSLRDVEELTKVKSEKIRDVYTEFYFGQLGLKSADWYDIFRFAFASDLPAAEARRTLTPRFPEPKIRTVPA